MAAGTTDNLSQDWKDWLAENAGRLLAYARQRCESQQEAEDVLQDALIKLWHYQKERDYVPPDLPLAFSILRYMGLDHGRRKGRIEKRNTKILQFQNDDDHWLDPPLEDSEDARELRDAVTELAPKLREILTLKIWSGLTFAEVAQVLEISPNTAASRYRYALGQLQKKLKHLKEPNHG